MLQKSLSSLFVFLLLNLNAQAFMNSRIPGLKESSLELALGYRLDQVAWTAEAGGIKSRVKWESLNAVQTAISIKAITCNQLYLRGYADYGWLTNGNAKGKDTVSYSGNRSLDDAFYEQTADLVYFSVSPVKTRNRARGHVYDLSFGAGYQFELYDCLNIAPLVGYSWHGQHFTGSPHSYLYSKADKDDYYRYISYSFAYKNSQSDHLSDLYRHTYHSRWYGPWLGLDFSTAVFCDWKLFFDYEFHWAHYRATVDRPRLDGLNHFNQHGTHAYGQRIVLGAEWNFCNQWTATLQGEYTLWNTRGREKCRVIDELSELKIDLKGDLKKVYWEAATVYLGAAYTF